MFHLKVPDNIWPLVSLSSIMTVDMDRKTATSIQVLLAIFVCSTQIEKCNNVLATCTNARASMNPSNIKVEAC